MYKRQKPKHYNIQSGNEAYLCSKNASCNWQLNLTVLISVMSNTLLCFLLFIRKIFWYREKHFAMLIVSINFYNLCSGELSRYCYRYLLSPFRHSPSWHSIVLLQLSFYLFTTALVVLDDQHPNIRQCIPGWEELNNTRVIIISTLKSENLPQLPKISIPRKRYIITQAFL